MRCPSPLCSLRPPDGIGGAGDDSALDRASGVERRLERLGLDSGDDARESPDGPMVRSPESSVDVRCDMCPRWSAKSLSETLRSATTGTQPWQGSWRVLVLGLSERILSSTIQPAIACCPLGDARHMAVAGVRPTRFSSAASYLQLVMLSAEGLSKDSCNIIMQRNDDALINYDEEFTF